MAVYAKHLDTAEVAYGAIRKSDLSIKHQSHVDTVLAYRLKYLARCDKEENNKKYIQYMKEVEVDWDKINQKIEEEYKRERELKTSPTKAKKPARH